jgi:hypothetical protein
LLKNRDCCNIWLFKEIHPPAGLYQKREGFLKYLWPRNDFFFSFDKFYKMADSSINAYLDWIKSNGGSFEKIELKKG